jgi:hypothetical protein
MNKICGYSCEHNKSGVCQISVCDKKLIMSNKTEVQTFTRYIDTTITKLQQENKKLNGAIQTYDILLKSNVEENKQLKDKLSKIETLIINHNCDTGDIYYKYNSRFLKSELKQRILEILYEEGSDSNEI